MIKSLTGIALGFCILFCINSTFASNDCILFPDMASLSQLTTNTGLLERIKPENARFITDMGSTKQEYIYKGDSSCASINQTYNAAATYFIRSYIALDNQVKKWGKSARVKLRVMMLRNSSQYRKIVLENNISRQLLSDRNYVLESMEKYVGFLYVHVGAAANGAVYENIVNGR